MSHSLKVIKSADGVVLLNVAHRRLDLLNRRKTVPDLSSDEWSVLGTIHVGIEGHLKVLRRQKYTWVHSGSHTKTLIFLHGHTVYMNYFRQQWKFIALDVKLHLCCLNSAFL